MKSQTDKYIKILKEANLKEARSVDEIVIKLKDIKGCLYSKKLDDLKLIGTEINTLIDDYKKDSLFASMITTMVLLFTLIISVIRETATIFSDPISKGLLNIFLILYVGGFLISLLLLFKSYTRKSKELIQMKNLLELLIEEREYLDKQHIEAIIEYSNYLKEGSPIT